MPANCGSLLATATPAAVLMDVQMPRVDGWTLTREIKANPRTRDVRVLVVSASVRDEDRLAAADEAGADCLHRQALRSTADRRPS